MDEKHFTLDDLGNRVFVVRPESWQPIEGGGRVAAAPLYQSGAGKRSRYPVIIIALGEKVFTPGGTASIGNPVYAAAANRKANDPDFNYLAYTCKFKGERGLMIRRIERK